VLSLGTSNPLRESLARCRRAFGFAALFSFVSNLLLLTISLYMLQLYDRVLTTRSTDTLIFLTLLALFALLTLGLIEIARSRLLVNVSAFLEMNLAPVVFERSISNSLQGHSYRTEALRDLTELRNFLTGSGVLALFDLPWGPLFLVMIFFLSPILGAVSAASMLLLLAFAFVNDRASRHRLKRANEIGVALMQEVDAYNRHAEIIDALGMVPALKTRWLAQDHLALTEQKTASDRAGTILGFSKFCRLAVQILILAAGALLVLRQELSGGAMIAASIMLARALAPVDFAIAVWRQLIGARAAFVRLDECLKAPPRRPASFRLPTPRGDITLENVTYVSDVTGRNILSGISCELAAGESLAIVGPSAAGKTTLARLMVGVLAPSGGHVRLDGADIFSWSRDDLGRHIGYLPQEISLFSGTIAENIARLGEVRPEEVVDAAQKANVHDMILRLPRGYDTEIGDAGWRLSGGQRQRIGLARALYGNPSFVLLDEPNANLDSEGDMALVRALAELKAQNATVIFITHRPGLIKYADKLILLRNGISELYGPREEIIDRLRLHGIGTGAIQDISKRRSSTQVGAMPRGAAR
jgi:PrtD family type I secretion system ABC transporter